LLKPVTDLIITSTDGQTASVFDIDPGGDPNLNDRGSEFTSSLAAGLAQAGNAPNAATRLRAAFGIALRLDAAVLTGLTHPQIWPERAPATSVPPTDTPTPTLTPTLTPTPVPVRIYRVRVTVFDDKAQQARTIGMPEFLELSVVDGTANFDGPAPFVSVTGQLGSDGSFQSVGQGTVAGIENVAVRFEGRLINGRLSGQYTLGTDGKLSQGQAITYELIGGLVQSLTPSPVPTSSN
jgi:hypothetical protein